MIKLLKGYVHVKPLILTGVSLFPPSSPPPCSFLLHFLASLLFSLALFVTCWEQMIHSCACKPECTGTVVTGSGKTFNIRNTRTRCARSSKAHQLGDLLVLTHVTFHCPRAHARRDAAPECVWQRIGIVYSSERDRD